MAARVRAGLETSWWAIAVCSIAMLCGFSNPPVCASDAAASYRSTIDHSKPAGHAPEPAAATLSGMGLFSVGWYIRLKTQKHPHRKFVDQAAADGFVIVDPGSEPLLRVVERRAYLFAKRAMDILLASIALILLSPLMMIIAVAIYIDAPGPVFYRQERLGEGRARFRLIKFRSMVVDADAALRSNAELMKEFEGIYKLKNDPRVTRVGAFLRKTSLDELPQLLNVLFGDISMVGPRPIVEAECEKYWPFEDRLFSVRPGVTGLWQVSGRNDISYEERVRLDMRYIAERSLLKDTAILAATLPALLKRDNGAY